MASKHQQIIKEERVAAYDEVLSIFPSATEMSRELSLDNRASVGQWRTRGVPIEYIMILDILGLVSKDKLIPSIRNWDTYLSKYEQVIRNKLNKMLLIDSLKKTTASTLQTVLRPAVEQMVVEILITKGLVAAPEEDPDSLE